MRAGFSYPERYHNPSSGLDAAHRAGAGSPPAPAKPLVFAVGPKIFFRQARIKGAKYAGPGSNVQGLQLLEKAVSSLPKDAFILTARKTPPFQGGDAERGQRSSP